MIFEHVATGGCQSYLVGCADTCAAALIDPEVRQVDRYLALATRDGLRIRFVIDTHTHADHFSASRRIAERLGAMTVMHRASPAPAIAMRVDDGESIVIGKLRLQVLHTPGHTTDSMCLVGDDRVFTGDTLLIGGTGRTDLPSGDPAALFDSLARLLALDPALLVFPAHDYKGRGHSTIGAEIAGNPRLQQRDRAAFVTMMKGLELSMPTHLTEALRTNMSGGKTVAEMLADVPDYVSTPELRIDVEEEKKFDLVARALEHFRSKHNVSDVDGVRVLFGDGWGLIRASNTQPIIVARYEAQTPDRLREIRGEMEGWLREQGVRV